MGLIGLRIARKPPDADHPYGHRKFETLAAAGIFVFLLLVVIEVVQTAFSRFSSGETPHVTGLTFAVMIGTLAVNLLVVKYEAGQGRALKSELLLADAAHTQSDVWTSCAVLASLAAVKLGFPAIDSVGAVVIAVFIARTGLHIGMETSGILADRVVLDEEQIRRVVMSVPQNCTLSASLIVTMPPMPAANPIPRAGSRRTRHPISAASAAARPMLRT